MLNVNEEYFLKIAELRNISKAADALYISQPSLTKYLQRLETKVGAPLFTRTQNAMKLTVAGRYLYDYIQNVSREEEKMLEKINEINNQGRDYITIGMPLWRSNVLLPEFMAFFHKKYPLIQVELREGKAADIEEWIRTEEIDFGIMNLPVNYADVSYDELIEEYVLLVASKENPVARKAILDWQEAGNHLSSGEKRKNNETKGTSENKAVEPEDRFETERLGFNPDQYTDTDTIPLIFPNAKKIYPHIRIQDIQDEPFILTKAGQHITDFIDQMLSRNHIELNCVFRTSNVGTAINMAATDFGFTFVPEFGTYSRFFPRNEVYLFTIDQPALRCTLAAVYKKSYYLSTASRIFITTVRDYCRNRMLFGRGDNQDDQD